ncbi:MAG: spermidine synthase [Desulfobacter sp.]|nr:spermidine synthase [Desulfobacter sp.]WDP85770.1 MAG: spermidine synthase [Desulfobacter sp.]
MGLNYEELDYQNTPIGELVLRRRRLLQLKGREIYEVKLGEEFLMSSLFHEAETQLSQIGLGRLDKAEFSVVVGGLGLGYTALAALENPNLASLVVVEFLRPVIDWHEKGLVPLGPSLCADPRCRLVQGDFFALSRDGAQGFDPDHPGKKQDAILLDIDHTPTRVLTQTNKAFYTVQGLSSLASHLNPGGVFGLWSDDRPDDRFASLLDEVFWTVETHVVEFDNPFTGQLTENTVYLGQTEPLA